MYSTIAFTQISAVYNSFNSFEIGRFEFYSDLTVINLSSRFPSDTGTYKVLSDTMLLKFKTKQFSAIILDNSTFCIFEIKEQTKTFHCDSIYKVVEYYPNGNIKEVCSYSNYSKGIFSFLHKPYPIKKHGKWYFYNDDGSIIRILKYKKGKLISVK